MLFSFRPILAVTILAGLIPLAVIGAPLSQVEGDIVKRAKELKAGDKFHLGETEHTLGPKLAAGSTSSVHSVEGHPNIVAKVFHKDGGSSPKARKEEIDHLKAVEEHHGDTEKDGHHIILATKKHGTKLPDTNAWKNAKTDEEKKAVKDKASKLTMEQNAHHAKEHNLVHTDAHYGNVLFHENEAGLHSAHFVDWGNALKAEKDKDHNLKQVTKDKIKRSGTKVVHGLE